MNLSHLVHCSSSTDKPKLCSFDTCIKIEHGQTSTDCTSFATDSLSLMDSYLTPLSSAATDDNNTIKDTTKSTMKDTTKDHTTYTVKHSSIVIAGTADNMPLHSHPPSPPMDTTDSLSLPTSPHNSPSSSPDIVPFYTHVFPEKEDPTFDLTIYLPSSQSRVTGDTVTQTTLQDGYIQFMLHHDPGCIGDGIDSLMYVKRKFSSVPKTGHLSYTTWDVYVLVRKLFHQEIKNWSQLVGKLGLSDRTGRPQFAQRVKRWMHKYKIDCYFDYLLGNPYDFHASSERYSSCLMLGNYQKRRVESMDTVHDSEHVSDEEVVLGDRDSCDSHFVPKRRRLEEEDKYGLLTDEEESSFHISAKKTSLPFDESESESDEEMLKCRESLRDPEDSQWSDEEDIVNSDRDTVQHYKTLYSTHTKQQEHHDSDKVLGDIREEDKKQGDDEEDEDEEDEKDELISSSSSSPSPHLFYYLPSYASSTAGPSAHTSPPLFPPPPTSTSTTTSPLPTTTSPLPITTTTNTTSTSTSCRPCESVTTKVIVMQDTISELKQHIVSLEAKMDQQAQANEVKWQKMIQLVRDREKRCERYERWRKRLVRDLLREPSEQSKPNTV